MIAGNAGRHLGGTATEEVAAGAGLLVDPVFAANRSPMRLRQVLDDDDPRGPPRVAGRQRAGELTWERCAENAHAALRGARRRNVSMSDLQVGVNLLWLVPGEVGGSEEYVCRLLEGFDEIPQPEIELTLFVNRRFWGAHPALGERASSRGRSDLGRARARPVSSPSRRGCTRGRTRSTSTSCIIPVARCRCAHAAPVLLSLHDLQYLDHPEFFSSVKRRYLRTAMPRSTAQAAYISAPTEFVRGTVIDHLGVDPDRVLVVPHGIPASEPGWGTPADVVRARYDLSGPFLLYPAVTWPHKNHVTAVRALAELRTSHPDLVLVLTGAPGPAEEVVAHEISRLGLTDAVRRTGRIPAVDINGLYDAAAMTVIPSRYEGFGIPALEAMRRGCPVVAARATALPEVVGDGGELVDPDDVDGWIAAIDADPHRCPASRSAHHRGAVTGDPLQCRAGSARVAGRLPSVGGGESQVKLVVG